MRHLFTILIMVVFMGSAPSQIIITQNQQSNITPVNSISCNAGTINITRENSYIRSFKLQDFGITSDFTITNVAFGVENVNGTFPVVVKLHRLDGIFPGGALTMLGTTNVTVSPVNILGMVDTGTNLSAIVPANSSFVVEINHNGADDNPPQAFFMGSNTSGQTGPSYLVAPACGMTTPTATGTGPLAGFANVRWVMTITGQSNVLGVTEVINSPDLQIYPNPVKDIVRFRFSNNLKSKGIEVYDMNGRIIASVQNNKNVNELNMSSYPKGNYILKVKTDDGRLYIKKIIKE